MERILKKKLKRPIQSDKNRTEQDHNEEAEFDFDKPSADSNAYVNTLEFPIEEDPLNLGTWIQLYHPNFFDGSLKGHLRYAFWLIFTLAVLVVQIIIIMKFDILTIDDSVENNKMYNKITDLGPAKVYRNWIVTVNNKAAKKESEVPNINDISTVMDLMDSWEDSMVQFAGWSVLFMILILITFQLKERFRLILLLYQHLFDKEKSRSRKIKIFVLNLI